VLLDISAGFPTVKEADNVRQSVRLEYPEDVNVAEQSSENTVVIMPQYDPSRLAGYDAKMDLSTLGGVGEQYGEQIVLAPGRGMYVIVGVRVATVDWLQVTHVPLAVAEQAVELTCIPICVLLWPFTPQLEAHRDSVSIASGPIWQASCGFRQVKSLAHHLYPAAVQAVQFVKYDASSQPSGVPGVPPTPAHSVVLTQT